MSLKEWLKKFTYEGEELWEYYLKKLEEYKNVDRLDELIGLMDSLKTNDVFLTYATQEDIGEEENKFEFDAEKLHFHKSVIRGLGYSHMIPFIPEISKLLIDGYGFASVLALIQLCFNNFSGHLITKEEDKIINLSEILPRITFFVEDFDNLNNAIPEYDESFFEKLHHIYWEDKYSEHFDNHLNLLIGSIYAHYELDYQYNRGFHRAAFYLMGCNALKEGRDSINCDDVVTAYFTGFKIILNDIRPLVYELYDEEKWADENSYK